MSSSSNGTSSNNNVMEGEFMGSRPIRCMCNLEIKENIPCPSYLLVCATLSVELDFVFFLNSIPEACDSWFWTWYIMKAWFEVICVSQTWIDGYCLGRSFSILQYCNNWSDSNIWKSIMWWILLKTRHYKLIWWKIVAWCLSKSCIAMESTIWVQLFFIISIYICSISYQEYL